MYKIGDLVVVLDAHDNTFLAYVKAIPGNDVYNLKLARNEIGLQRCGEIDVEVFTVDRIVRIIDCYINEK